MPCSNIKSNSVDPDVIKEMKDALRDSIFQTFRNSTLCELARIFRGTEIHQDICWTITKIQGFDKRYLDRGLGELRELFKKDDNVSSVPGLNQRVDRLASSDSYYGGPRIRKHSMTKKLELVNPRQNVPVKPPTAP